MGMKERLHHSRVSGEFSACKARRSPEAPDKLAASPVNGNVLQVCQVIVVMIVPCTGICIASMRIAYVISVCLEHTAASMQQTEPPFFMAWSASRRQRLPQTAVSMRLGFRLSHTLNHKGGTYMGHPRCVAMPLHDAWLVYYTVVCMTCRGIMYSR